MNVRIIRVLFSMIVLLQLVSCASTGENRYLVYDNYIKDNNLKSVKRVYAFQFKGWNSLDNKHLIVDSNQKKSYLLKLTAFCNDLNIANTIIFDQSMNNRLTEKFDSVIVPGAMPRMECPIDRIYTITQQQRKDILSLKR